MTTATASTASPKKKFKTPPNLYNILGLATSIHSNSTSSPPTPNEIKQAYRRCCFKYHPDKNSFVQKEDAERMFQLVTLVYTILTKDNDEDEERKSRTALIRYHSFGWKSLKKTDRKSILKLLVPTRSSSSSSSSSSNSNENNANNDNDLHSGWIEEDYDEYIEDDGDKDDESKIGEEDHSNEKDKENYTKYNSKEIFDQFFSTHYNHDYTIYHDDDDGDNETYQDGQKKKEKKNGRNDIEVRGHPFQRMGLYDTVDFQSKGKTKSYTENKDAKDKTTTSAKKKIPTKMEEEYFDLPCTLEEIYNGIEKKIEITRKRFNIDLNTLVDDTHIITINVPKGIKSGTRIHIHDEGDASETQTAGDLIFTICEIPHEHYQRDDENNLIHTVKISLCDALTDCIVKIPPFLVGVNKKVGGCKSKIMPCFEMIHSNYERRFVGEGMPKYEMNGSQKKGDLIIRFNVEYPKVLTVETKNALRKLLGDVP